MPIFHSTTVDTGRHIRESNLVAGWASGLVQVWPDEDPDILLPDGPRIGPHRHDVLATPAAVIDVLAAADGQDPATYRRTYAAEAGAVLALTHHSEDELLAASVAVRGALHPSRVLAIIHNDMDPGQHLLAS